jgi:hypothetical protein
VKRRPIEWPDTFAFISLAKISNSAKSKRGIKVKAVPSRASPDLESRHSSVEPRRIRLIIVHWPLPHFHDDYRVIEHLRLFLAVRDQQDETRGRRLGEANA